VWVHDSSDKSSHKGGQISNIVFIAEDAYSHVSGSSWAKKEIGSYVK